MLNVLKDVPTKIVFASVVDHCPVNLKALLIVVLIVLLLFCITLVKGLVNLERIYTLPVTPILITRKDISNSNGLGLPIKFGTDTGKLSSRTVPR